MPATGRREHLDHSGDRIDDHPHCECDAQGSQCDAEQERGRLIDAAGHPERAREAAQQRRHYVETHVVAGGRERVLDFDLLGFVDSAKQGEQIQADESQDDDRRWPRQ